MKITELEINTPAVLLKIEGDDHFVRRFYDLGFYPGCELMMTRRFGKGGPVVIALSATSYSMRLHEAEALSVRLKNG